jgi:hypothetical protein
MRQDLLFDVETGDRLVSGWQKDYLFRLHTKLRFHHSIDAESQTGRVRVFPVRHANRSNRGKNAKVMIVGEAIYALRRNQIAGKRPPALLASVRRIPPMNHVLYPPMIHPRQLIVPNLSEKQMEGAGAVSSQSSVCKLIWLAVV